VLNGLKQRTAGRMVGAVRHSRRKSDRKVHGVLPHNASLGGYVVAVALKRRHEGNRGAHGRRELAAQLRDADDSHKRNARSPTQGGARHLHCRRSAGRATPFTPTAFEDRSQTNARGAHNQSDKICRTDVNR
jgi:hypothetical protein